MRKLLKGMFLALLLASAAMAEPSASAYFSSVVQAHFVNSKVCWHQERIPSEKRIQREISGMVSACSRFWPGDESAPYWLCALMLSESGGNSRNTAKPGELSFGPWCMTVSEAKTACRILGMPIKRWKPDIEEDLQTSIEWSALVTAGVVWLYERACGGDRIRAMMIYKYGVRGLERAIFSLPANAPITELAEWKKLEGFLQRLACLKVRIELGEAVECGCDGR